MDELAAISQSLLQFSPDAMVVVDERGVIQFVNETTLTIFGYTQQQLIGRSIEILVPERFHFRHAAHISSYMRDPTSREMGARFSDLFARRADATEFSAGIRLAPFHIGNKRYIAAAIRDMTERREINEALVAAREEADRANRAKSRFLATASHDLRQPLQTIRMLNASMQKLSGGSGNLDELLRRQEYAIDGATRMLNALLDISRLESGAVEVQSEEVSLASVFVELEREFESAAADKNLRLVFAETNVSLLTDRMLFTQLLQNLIGNAIKYTEQGKIKISQSIDAEALTLEVEDSGVGIPQDKLERIFDEYYQVDNHGTQRMGVGLGLAIVREVVRILGYSITVASTVGKGTRIRVRVPRQKLLALASAATVADQGSHPAATPSHCRVILLEDNDSVRVATELFLSLEGYDAHSAGSIAEAEPLLASMQQGDLLITDYHLDGSLTGLDVLLQVRAMQGRDVPAIILSGDLQPVLRVLKTPLANCRFLSKPVDTKALLAAIAELCDR
jgi:PAS domain S-box-containing protein